jgi:hypothetical protein
LVAVIAVEVVESLIVLVQRALRSEGSLAVTAVEVVEDLIVLV